MSKGRDKESDLPKPAAAMTQEPKKRADAVPFIGYRSLLCTDRAVKYERGVVRRGIEQQIVYDLILTFAGDRDDLQRDNAGVRSKRLRYLSARDAKTARDLLLVDLRQAKTDYQYNQILVAYLSAVMDVKLGVRYVHVHDCAKKGEDCSFDWQPHFTNPDDPTCPCNPQMGDMNDSAPEDRPERFVIHQGEER